MKILLLHAEDSLAVGPWAGQHWDSIFDLARGGWAAYERWSRATGCPVKPIDDLREGFADTRRVRELMQLGLGRLVDREGLDWWELTAIMFHDYLERLVLLRKLATSFPSNAEAWITRDGIEARALRMILGDRLRVMDAGARRARKGLRHYVGRLHRLPAAQVLQTLGDKYDGGYRVRRYFHRRGKKHSRPAVLVPSSYVNMSLTGSAYASVLPETDFLLVSTRASGRLRQSPANVTQAWLASYASESRKNEYEDIYAQWMRLKPEIA